MTLARKTLLPALIILAFSCSYLPEGDINPDGVITDENRDLIEVIPESGAGSTSGLLFYPGGLVDPHAYIELASRFALSGIGHRVLIAKMPSNLAVMASKSARKILRDEGHMDWVIAGHSLGGAMACSMVESEPDLFLGMVLMAAYSPSSGNLKLWKGEVLSIGASEDRVVDWDKYEEGKERLPASSEFVIIQGGNHAGFGSYGSQDGDGEATISLEMQHNQIIEHLQRFYEENGFE